MTIRIKQLEIESQVFIDLLGVEVEKKIEDITKENSALKRTNSRLVRIIESLKRDAKEDRKTISYLEDLLKRTKGE